MRKIDCTLSIRFLACASLGALCAVSLSGCLSETVSTAPSSSTEIEISRKIPAAILDDASPIYPEWALEQGVGDTVVVDVYLGDDSFVKKIDFTRPAIHADFDSAVARSLLATKYKAAQVDGKPVEDRFTKKFIFEI